MKKSFKQLLEELEYEKLEEAKKFKDDEEDEGVDDETDEEEDDEDEEDEPSTKELPQGKGHYTADDLKEIIVYVQDLIRKEHEEDEDDDSDGKDKKDDDFGDVGLDLISEYADLLPETVINQIVADLKDIFEVEDTMLESIVTEGAFFNKSIKGPAAKAAKSVMKSYYRKNKTKLLKRNKKWRNSEIGKRMIALHRKIMSGMGKVKGKHVVHPEF